MALTDSNGNTVAQYTYDAWGNVISQSGTLASINPYLYASYRWDSAIGMYYLNARYYNPTIMRFISHDSLGGMNAYAYCSGNPANRIDPSGEGSLEQDEERIQELNAAGEYEEANAIEESDSEYYSVDETEVDDTVEENTVGISEDEYTGSTSTEFSGDESGPITGDVVGTATSSNSSVVKVVLKYKEGWSAEQRSAADAKVAALNKAVTVKTPVRQRTAVTTARYRKENNTAGYDVDHVVDLQLGGKDEFSNMAPLDRSVNRSLGSQIRNQIKSLPFGTVISCFIIS